MSERHVLLRTCGQEVLSICLVAVLFLSVGASHAKQTRGVLIESGCFSDPRIRTDDILEIIKTRLFEEGDCIRISWLDGITPIKTRGMAEFGWLPQIIRGYGRTPEEGCVAARRFIEGLKNLGWNPPAGFQPSCHAFDPETHLSWMKQDQVEIFLWKFQNVSQEISKK